MMTEAFSMPHHSEAMKVSFDTNVFKRLLNHKAGKPDPRKSLADASAYDVLLDALDRKLVKGFFSDTFITLEGVQNIDRSHVFGGREISSKSSSIKEAEIVLSIGASMPESSLHATHIVAVSSLIDLGFLALRGPIYLGDNFTVPSTLQYVYEPIDGKKFRGIVERMELMECAIGKRNLATGASVGKCRARSLGLKNLFERGRNSEIWYQGLGLSTSGPVRAAIREWSDAELVIRHFGHANDYLCTHDWGRGSGLPSIFDDTHRDWLESEYGIKFITANNLADLIVEGSEINQH